MGFLSKKLASSSSSSSAATATTAAAATGGGGRSEGQGKGPVGNVQVFCYVNSVFAPGLDEGVGGLWKVG